VRVHIHFGRQGSVDGKSLLKRYFIVFLERFQVFLLLRSMDDLFRVTARHRVAMKERVQFCANVARECGSYSHCDEEVCENDGCLE